MALDENGRPSAQALLVAMKRDFDEQVSRLNDNRVYLLALVEELQQENTELKATLDVLNPQPEPVYADA